MENFESNKKTFKENGYLVLENIISEKKINAVLANVYRMFLRYVPSTRLLDLQEPWKSDLFNEELIKFRDSNPKEFSVIYDSAQSSVSVEQLVSGDEIVNEIANVLDTSPLELSVTGRMVRMDPPNDKRNISNWHQEINFFRNPGLVLWIPLVEITSDMGFLQVCEKSHLDGEIMVNFSQAANYETSKVSGSIISLKQLNQYRKKSVEMKKGDALLFDNLLLHSSGINYSNRIRFSCNARFANSSSKEFAPWKEERTYNPYVIEQLRRKLY